MLRADAGCSRPSDAVVEPFEGPLPPFRLTIGSSAEEGWALRPVLMARRLYGLLSLSILYCLSYIMPTLTAMLAASHFPAFLS